MSGITPKVIFAIMQSVCNDYGIPATFEEATVTEGGASSVLESIGYGQKPSFFKAFHKFIYVGTSKAYKDRNEYEEV